MMNIIVNSSKAVQSVVFLSEHLQFPKKVFSQPNPYRRPTGADQMHLFFFTSVYFFIYSFRISDRAISVNMTFLFKHFYYV